VLTTIDRIDFGGIDLAFCALPHATSQEVIAGLPRDLRIVDLSADFRLRDPAAYARWYGHEHRAPELQAEAVYGLTEFYREEIRAARLVAGTGCNSATGLYALLPLLRAGVIDPDEIIIDLATGISGAGRSPKEEMLHAETSEGFHAYNVARHRHLAEFDQEFSRAAGRPVQVTFTPHLAPMNRGILVTAYVRGEAEAVHAHAGGGLRGEPFLVVLPLARRRRRGTCGVELRPSRRDRRPAAWPGDGLRRPRQPHQGLVGAGAPEREPDARPAGDDGPRGGAALSVSAFAKSRLRMRLAGGEGGARRLLAQRRLGGGRLHRLHRPARDLPVPDLRDHAGRHADRRGAHRGAHPRPLRHRAGARRLTLEPVVRGGGRGASERILTCRRDLRDLRRLERGRVVPHAFDRAYRVIDPRGFVVRAVIAVGFVFIGAIVAALLGASILLTPSSSGCSRASAVPVPGFASYLANTFGLAVFGGFVYLLHRTMPGKSMAGKLLWPGVLFTTVVWLVAAVGFSIYLTYTPTYSITYGALAGVIITLMFFYITGVVIIFGAELNAALNRALDRAEAEEGG
jgi:N-acetyl-gamma-glutamyl-phosphate reductase